LTIISRRSNIIISQHERQVIADVEEKKVGGDAIQPLVVLIASLLTFGDGI
jgi:hypothetical protein